MGSPRRPVGHSDNGGLGSSRRNSERAPQPPRNASRSSTKASLDKQSRTPPDPDRQPTVLVRKKLPWLDGSRTIPGQFDSKESLGLGAESVPSTRTKANESPSRTAAEFIATPPFTNDPALRTVGSTPSLRGAARPKNSRSLSLTSQPRPGVQPIHAKRQAAGKLRIVNETLGTKTSASSLYSATTPPTDGDGPVPARALSNVDSYERLIEKFSPSTGAAALRNPFRDARAYEDDDDDSPVSPRAQRKSFLAEQGEAIRRRSKKPLIDHASSEDLGHAGSHVKSDGRMNNIQKPQPRRHPSMECPFPESNAAPPALTKKPTLFAMPTHLLAPSSSPSPDYVRKSHSQPMANPQRPAPSLPQANSHELRRQSHSLNRAVTGLENLMQEALTIAKDAAQSGQNEEVAGILNSATLALRKASTVRGSLHPGRMSQPLVLSPPASECGSESDSSEAIFSDASSTQSGRCSIDTAPTLVTKSAQSSRPILVEHDSFKSLGTRSMKASVEPIAYPDAVRSADRQSISRTPPQLYQPPSADSIVKDFAYSRAKTAKGLAPRKTSRSQGAASDYYGDAGQSVETQPGVRLSLIAPMITDDSLPKPPARGQRPSLGPMNEPSPSKGRKQRLPVQHLEPVPTLAVPPRTSSRSWDNGNRSEPTQPTRRRERQHRPHHISKIFESSYYHQPPTSTRTDGVRDSTDKPRGESTSHIADTRYDAHSVNESSQMAETSRNHISLREGQGFSLGRHHRRQPIAREWSTSRKRITATIACANTVFVGLIAGIYAGEVPRIQYQLADTTHKVILGNVLLFATLGATTLLFWPLPLLHGRKPYTLVSFALMLPLMFPQAIVVSSYRDPTNPLYRCGLLIPRAIEGVAMGFANINFLPTLFDLFGASLMSALPHQEIVVYDDVRRQGGGVGIWLGIWSWCFVGSMSIGFAIGAFIISRLDPSWGFYIVVVLLAFFLLVNVIAPETRRAPYRRSIAQFLDGEERVKRRVARGEVLLHISNDGPRWWWEEVWAGMVLTKRMVGQVGFCVMMVYLGWIYAQVTLVILLLGALLTRDYQWQPQYVAPAVLAVAVGAALAVPLSKANLFSRARDTPQRTDSMTMQHHHHHEHVHWSSHMLRRCIFTLTLPLAAIAYTLTSPGPPFNWAAPTIFCGLVGFLSNLAIAECVGIIMESFDTCDLQPGVNQKHRLQSMAETTRRRRTNYSSFPRICAGFFAAQSTGFFLSAAATGAAGDITRAVGAQMAVAICAAILLILTILFIAVLWRWKAVQVIPNNAFGSLKGDAAWSQMAVNDPEWKPVIIGNPSGKMRRMNLLEMGSLSRWTEIRRLNKLVKN